MKILALADEVVSFIHSPTVRDRFADVDLVVSCGDLPAAYLEYVVTLLNKPLVYVPGIMIRTIWPSPEASPSMVASPESKA